jgi:hypothetical protein
MTVQMHLITYESRLEKGLFTAARTGVKAALVLANKAFVKNISMTCHDQAELTAEDHPYASRHGPTGKPIHLPYWKIHKQSGGLIANSLSQPVLIETADAVTGNFGFTPDPLPNMLVGGTSKMIPRPVVSGTLGMVKGQIKKIIIESFKKRYGSNVTPEVSFGA